jgi:site-specific recombinase XerD
VASSSVDQHGLPFPMTARRAAMLEALFRTEQGRRRYLVAPLGAYLDSYLESLSRRGFTTRQVRNHALRAAAFGEYLAEHNVPLAALAQEHIEEFGRWYLAQPRRYGTARQPGHEQSTINACRGCARGVLGYLRDVGATPATPAPPPAHPHLRAYLEFLEHHRGFVLSTRERHAEYVRRFLKALEPIALDTLATTQVEHVVIALSKGLCRYSQRDMVSAIDAFLQFERSSGRIPMSCQPLLPRRRVYALAQLPTALSQTEVERVLAAVDRSSAIGRRDYAVLQLLAAYGLRSSEIADLRLEDIDWRGAVLHIRQRKVRRRLLLPLLERATAALIAYLRNGRPVTGDRRLFQKCHAPAGPMTPATVYELVRKAIQTAGLAPPHAGPHVFRHARATSLLRRGVALKTIGDLLGHRVPDTTAIYCKLAVDDLRTVALEIPGQAVRR